jgi:UTP--glucose-1-phosphate uridylyltransferase
MRTIARIRKAVIPAAGLGTRFLPATKVIPKEMLPIAGKPLIQIAVEEAVASGVDTVIVVIGKGKNLLQEHFHRDAALEALLTGRGCHEEAARIRRLSQMVEIRTAWQQAPRGLADAIRSARSLLEDEPFAVLLPDAVIDSDEPCIGQLMRCYESHPGCIIATRLVKPVEIERFGTLDLIPMRDRCCGGRTSRVSSLTERPRAGTTGSRYGIFGRYVLEPGIFDAIEQTHPGIGGELQLTDSLLISSNSIPLYGFRFVGEHYDAGSKLGFLQANLAYALKDAGLGPPLREYLAKLRLESENVSLATVYSA